MTTPNILQSDACGVALQQLGDIVIKRMKIATGKTISFTLFVWDEDGSRYVANHQEADVKHEVSDILSGMGTKQ